MGYWCPRVIDWDYVYEKVQPNAIFIAGIIFGIAWAVWADAIVYSIAILHASFNAVYVLPGLVATVAVGLMNCVSREDLEYAYNDDAAVMRSKLVGFAFWNSWEKYFSLSMCQLEAADVV